MYVVSKFIQVYIYIDGSVPVAKREMVIAQSREGVGATADMTRHGKSWPVYCHLYLLKTGHVSKLYTILGRILTSPWQSQKRGVTGLLWQTEYICIFAFSGNTCLPSRKEAYIAIALNMTKPMVKAINAFIRAKREKHPKK